jgi:hypothetical protein
VTKNLLESPSFLHLQPEIDQPPNSFRPREGSVLTFLVNDYGRPFASAAAFGNKFADWCDAAGLQPVLCDDGRTRNYRAHGLRKAALYTLPALTSLVILTRARGAVGHWSARSYGVAH